jgi:hypothetical protein
MNELTMCVCEKERERGTKDEEKEGRERGE